MYSANEIAKWFLAYNCYKCNEEGADSISNLKLQKLLYYAQGGNMAINGAPLFGDAIEAWKHGPVVPAVYHEYKSFGSDGIAPPQDFIFTTIGPTETNVLEQIYDEFGKYSAWGLRELTHSEDPWKNTPLDSVIPNDLICKYFSDNYIVE